MHQFVKYKNGITLLIALLFIQFCNGQLRVANIFSNNMVLQQNSSAPIWGWANRGEVVKITASWLENEIEITADKKGYWRTKLPTTNAGNIRHHLSISTDTTIEIRNILMGEVWICSGQSNMEMPLKGFKNQPVYGSNKLIVESRNTNIRHFNVDLNYSAEPLDNCSGSWTEASPETTPDYSAVAYVFSKSLNIALDVPIGIINTTWGGTPVEAWMEKEELEQNFTGIDLSVLHTYEMKFQSPTVLFNAMVKPIVGYNIKGVIWYQGESNISRPLEYAELFPAMIGNWRDNWQQGNFPFHFVQICPMQNYDYRYQYSYVLREAQLNTLKKVPNTGMVSTLDIGAQWNIHPPKKIEIGERLAYLALNNQYGFKEIQCGGPQYKSMEIIGETIILEFENAPLGISSMGKDLSNFIIAGSDRVFHKAKAEIKVEWDVKPHLQRALVQVTSDSVKSPIAVRYGWSNWLVGSLFDTGGNPASSFRTDDWEIPEIRNNNKAKDVE